MLALVRERDAVHLRELPCPSPGPGELLVRVGLAGLCRTDLYVARGELTCTYPRVLGHECGGRVAARGPGVKTEHGARVAVFPFIGCGACPGCDEQRPHRCPAAAFLGLDLDGAFAEYLCVPERATHVVPDSMSWRRIAYAEPVAASMAVLHADLDPNSPGLLFGEGRIVELTRRVLEFAGFGRVRVATRDQLDSLEPDSFDFIIETQLGAGDPERLLPLLRAGGRLVLKSRPARPVPFNLRDWVAREIDLRAVSYAPFEHAIARLADPTFVVEDLFGEIFESDDWSAFLGLDESVRNESHKSFIRFDPEAR